MADKHLAIIGCGLIGGSVGIALKRRQPNYTISCLDRKERLPAIADVGFADHLGTLEDAAQYLPQCNLVMLASPVEVIIEHIKIIAPHLREGTVVTDVGSTKTEIIDVASKFIPEGVSFIGGHPIAGSEASGIESANPLLFKGRVYVLCPSPSTPPEALLMLIDMVEDLLALPLTIEPEEHDRILAMVSHVPQITAIALVHAAVEGDTTHKLLEVTVGQGFLDITRIAASGFRLWEGILKTNRRSIQGALDNLEKSFETVRRAIDNDDVAALWERVSRQRRKMGAVSLSRMQQSKLRDLIDHHDEQILKALSDRLQVARRIGKIKKEQDAPVYDPDRERRLMAKRHDWGKSLDIAPDLIDELFTVIMKHAKLLQTVPSK